MLVSPAFWAALPHFSLNWDAPPERVMLPGGHPLTLQQAPDGTRFLTLTFHASEDFSQLFDGRGQYTDAERDDPYEVIEQRWERAREVMGSLRAEAVQELGQPPRTGQDRPARTSWMLDDRTITVGLQQADQDCPIEVCLWVLPPGLTPDSLHL